MSASEPSVRTVGGYADPIVRDPRIGTANRSASPEPAPATPPVPRPTSARPSGARPAAMRPPGSGNRAPRPGRPPGAPQRLGAPRRARLTLARLDPWGVLKLSFLLAVALGIMGVVAVAVLWQVIDGMGVFTDINNVVRGIDTTNSEFDVIDYVGFERILSLATVIGVANVLLMTVLSTLFAFLYNLGSALVGGVRVVLTDD